MLYTIAVIFPFDKGRQWVSDSTLSAQFGKYDSENAHSVVFNQRDLRLYNNKNIQVQDLIIESRHSNYIVNKNCPEHYIWIKHQKQSQKAKLPVIPKHPNDKHNN